MILSIVIPCYNEEQFIGKTLESIFNYVPEGITFEVLVVDNGSTDDSISIAKTYNTRIISSCATTIGGVRNDGVESATGEVLLFIDADVLLTSSWSKTIASVLSLIYSCPLNIYGSHCSVPYSENASYLDRYWFKAIEVNTSSHVGTGHMLIKASTFNKLNGFDERLISGEDYDLCKRAKALGGEVVEVNSLKVFHLGYPKTLRGFFKRELMHGKGDWDSFEKAIRSKVVILSIVNFVMIASIALTLLSYQLKYTALLIVLYALFLVIISYIKFKIFDHFFGLIFRAGIFSVYFTARLFSVFYK